MLSLLDSAWMQSIIGGLIVAGILKILKDLSAGKYPIGELIFCIIFSTVVIMFGGGLQEISQRAIEGNDSVILPLLYKLRKNNPPLFFVSFFLISFPPSVVIAFKIIKNDDLNGYIKNGVLWTPLSLLMWDAISFIVLKILQQYGKIQINILNPNLVYYSILSDLFGGALGGVMIGVVMYYFSKIFARNVGDDNSL